MPTYYASPPPRGAYSPPTYTPTPSAVPTPAAQLPPSAAPRPSAQPTPSASPIPAAQPNPSLPVYAPPATRLAGYYPPPRSGTYSPPTYGSPSPSAAPVPSASATPGATPSATPSAAPTPSTSAPVVRAQTGAFAPPSSGGYGSYGYGYASSPPGRCVAQLTSCPYLLRAVLALHLRRNPAPAGRWVYSPHPAQACNLAPTHPPWPLAPQVRPGQVCRHRPLGCSDHQHLLLPLRHGVQRL
jgi:hypothetical protein